MKKTVLLTALTCSLSLTACGGSVNSPGADTIGSLSNAPLASLSSASTALTPLESLDETGSEAHPQENLTDTAPVAGQVAETAAPETPVETANEVPGEATADTDTNPPEAPTETLPDLDAIPEMDVNAPYVPAGSSFDGGDGYSADGNFQVDQDTFNQWQAVNLVSDGTYLYVAAVDVKTPTKGTVIQMDTSGGSWKDLGKSLLSTFTFGAAGYKMTKTIQGIALDDAGNIIVADKQNQLFSMAASDRRISTIPVALSNVLDIVSIGNAVYVATTTGIQKFDTSSLSTGSTFSTVVPSGGMGRDSQGNLYVVSNDTIQKIDSSGQATQVVSGLNTPLDVSVDSTGQIFVLESDNIKYFKSSGESLGSFGMGDFTAPKSIFVESSGTVYVADAGTSHKDSQIVRFVKG